MTNYNERLDEILDFIENYGVSASCDGFDPHKSRNEAKQALTSLIKELVAEAKPANSETQRGGVTVYGDLSERELNVIDQFEQNLLKALEEKK